VQQPSNFPNNSLAIWAWRGICIKIVIGINKKQRRKAMAEEGRSKEGREGKGREGKGREGREGKGKGKEGRKDGRIAPVCF